MANERMNFADYNPSDFHIDGFLTSMLVGYRPQGLIADQVYPVLPVGKQSDLFAKMDKGNWFRRPTTLRAIGTAPEEVHFTVSSDRYQTVNYELGTTIPFEVQGNADAPHDPRMRSSEFLMDQLMLDYEMRVATKTWAGCGSSQVLTGGAAFSDFAGSDPLTVFETGNEAIRATTGYQANVAICPQKTWLKLRRHPDVVRALFPGAGVGGIASPDQLAGLIGVDRILIPKAIVNTATATVGGEANNAFSDVWSTSIVLAYVAPAPGIMIPTFGTTFRWTGADPANFTVTTRRDSKRKVEELQTGYYQDEKIVAAELGFLIATGITA